MNKVILMGRPTRDPEIRYTSGGNSEQMCIAKYFLAVDRRFRRDGEPTADFIPCTAFGKQAEFAEKYIRQGKRLVVTGRIQTGSYTNRDGQKVYTTDVIIEDQEFAESKSAEEGRKASGDGNHGNQGYGSGNTGYGNNYQNGNGNRRGYSQNQQTTPDGFMNIPEGIDEELPFT